MTYKDIINLLEESKMGLFVPVFYHTGVYEWLPVDKQAYLRQLKLISNNDIPFPCLFEVESDGEMFIHPKMENNQKIVTFVEG